MSKFRKAAAAVEELKDVASTLEAKGSEGSLDEADVLATRVSELAASMDKMESNAKETNDDAKIYGPSMALKVLALVGVFREVQQTSVRIQSMLAPVKERVQAKVEAVEVERQRQKQADEEVKAREEKERVEAAVKAKQEVEKIEQDRARQAAENKARAEQMERDMYEAELGQQQERLARLKRAEESNISVEEGLALLAQHCSCSQYQNALRVLVHILTTVCDEPESVDLRTIRIKNPNFQKDIAQHVGGEDTLVAMGFRIEESEAKGAQWVMREPDLDHFEEWPEWFEEVKRHRSKLVAASKR